MTIDYISGYKDENDQMKYIMTRVIVSFGNIESSKNYNLNSFEKSSNKYGEEELNYEVGDEIK